MVAVRTAIVFVLLIGTSTLSWTGSLAAEAYPSKPVLVIVPFPPGGRTDLTFRLLAPYVEKSLGQPLTILNKSGAGGVIGFRDLARAHADGYTIGFTSNAVVTAQYMVASDLNLQEYEPICLINTDPVVFAVAYSAPWKDVRSLVKFAKENPNRLQVGINQGAATHLFAAAFARAAEIEVMLIPYKGGGERVAALAGGHIDADFGVLSQYRSMMHANKLRILGVAATSRLPSNKDVPTFIENGVNIQFNGWHGLFAPQRTPINVLHHLDESVRKALSNDELIQMLEKTADVQTTYMPREDFTRFLRKEDVETRQLLRELGLMVTTPR